MFPDSVAELKVLVEHCAEGERNRLFKHYEYEFDFKRDLAGFRRTLSIM